MVELGLLTSTDSIPTSTSGSIVESVAWYTWALEPPTDTVLPLMSTATTMALSNPPGTTEVGIPDHDWLSSVLETVTLWKAFPVPALLDL